MRCLQALLLIPLLAFGAEVGTDSRKIIGGRVTNSLEFPAVLYVGGCTGSLVADRWALTAAHCVAGKNPIGMEVERGYPEDYESRESVLTVVHPAYVDAPNGTRNDVALVQFDRPFQSGTVQIQNLADEKLSELLLQPGTMTTSVGWGQKGRGLHSDDLRTAQWPISPCPDTADFEEFMVTDEMFCRKNIPWTSQIHRGDSGGPVLIQHQGEKWQVGWATYNANALVNGSWQYYSISHKTAPYLEWITETIRSVPAQQHTTVEQDFKELHRLARELDDDLREFRQRLVDLIYGIDRLRTKAWEAGVR